MIIEEKMTVDERYKYLRKMKKRYKKAKRADKSKLLDEMGAVTGLHRKSLIRLMQGQIARKERQRQRGRTYGAEVGAAIDRIAESLDYICAERLQPNLGWMAAQLVRHGELQTSPTVLQQLERVSISTVRRILSRQPRERPRLPRKGPQRANQLRRTIAAERICWQEQHPGHFEVDLVHHCGVSASGHYVHTLQMIDVATGWSERVATLGRSYLVMQDGFSRILARLPFPVVEIHPDNGSEFLNQHLVRFWREKISGVRLSRTRPWHKNDNRFVEQKNSTLVRAYLGYDRLDTVAQTKLLNKLYDHMWLYYNFFQPVMRLQQKFAAPAQPGQRPRIIRRFDRARTPFDRLCATGVLRAEQLAPFRALRDATNPRQLRREINALIEQLFALPLAAPEDTTQDVYLTLFNPSNSIQGEISPVTLSYDRTIPAR